MECVITICLLYDYDILLYIYYTVTIIALHIYDIIHYKMTLHVYVRCIIIEYLLLFTIYLLLIHCTITIPTIYSLYSCYNYYIITL